MAGPQEVDTTVKTVYEVQADSETGEWLGEPEPVDEVSTPAAWALKVDEQDGKVHYDTYEHFLHDDIGRAGSSSETRLIRVIHAQTVW